MEMWIYMVIIVLVIPIILIVFGQIFRSSPPRKINNLYGYRTKRSMKNDATWKFAHMLCGKIWLYTGVLLMIASVIWMLFMYTKDSETIAISGLILVGIQGVVILLTLIPVEIGLKNKFDLDGFSKS